MDAPLKMYTLLASVSRTQIVTSKVWNRLLAGVRFSKHVQFQIHPPLNILTVPDWLNFKFHYFLIGPKVKILITVTRLAPIYVTLFYCHPRVNSFTRLTDFPYCASVTSMVSFLARFKMFKSCQTLQRQYVEIKCQLDATEVFIADLIAY